MGLKHLILSKDGTLSESKVWSNVGKAIAAYLAIRHGAAVIQHWDVLTVLLGWLICPDIIKKFIAMRYGAPKESVP